MQAFLVHNYGIKGYLCAVFLGLKMLWEGMVYG